MTVVIIEKTGIKSSQRLKSLSAFVHRLHPLEGTFTPSSWLLFSSSAQAKSWKWKKREKNKLVLIQEKQKEKSEGDLVTPTRKTWTSFSQLSITTYTAFMMKRFRQSDVAVNRVNYNCAESQKGHPWIVALIYLLSTDFPEEILISRCNNRIRNISAVRQHWKEGWNFLTHS